jgi:hypothetical protein
LNRRLADTHILPALGELRVIEVEPPRLQRWVDTMARTLSPSTVSMCAALLSAATNNEVSPPVSGNGLVLEEVQYPPELYLDSQDA